MSNNDITVWDIADMLAGQNMGSFRKVLADHGISYILGVLEGAGYQAHIPLVLVHSNEVHGDYIRFSVVHGVHCALGSIHKSYAPLKKA